MKRMFSSKITETDDFYDMPLAAQALYFHLAINADDEGFTGNPKSIIKLTGASPEDLKTLESAGYVIVFDSGVIVITHWKAQNTIKPDRLKETMYTDEKAKIEERNGAYYTLSP